MERTKFRQADDKIISFKQSVLDSLLFGVDGRAAFQLLYYYIHLTLKTKTNLIRVNRKDISLKLGITVNEIKHAHILLLNKKYVKEIIKGYAGGFTRFIKVNLDVIGTATTFADNSFIINNKTTLLGLQEFQGNVDNNMLDSSIESALPIVPSAFTQFYNLYPKHVDKGKALSAWEKICKKPPKDRPTWRMIKRAIVLQKKTQRWEDPKYIPNPATWLNNRRWLDEVETMTVRPKELDPKKPPFIRVEGLGRYDLHTDGEYYHVVTGYQYIP